MAGNELPDNYFISTEQVVCPHCGAFVRGNKPSGQYLVHVWRDIDQYNLMSIGYKPPDPPKNFFARMFWDMQRNLISVASTSEKLNQMQFLEKHDLLAHDNICPECRMTYYTLTKWFPESKEQID